jgi:PKHD-type hydroxylase|tara:strand:+ start:4791 stop:5387 length:597 start_codon:yes stop_codon:yes gene_type:complete
MFHSFNFDQQEVDLQQYYFFRDGFDKDELAKIESNVAKLPFNNATTAGGHDKKLRSSSVKWIPQNDDWYWLYETLADYATQANFALWNFDLHQIPEQIQYTEYYASEQGHYDWHADIGPGLLSKRKVSITVQLSDPDEYEGGDLEIFKGGSMSGPFDKAERKAGCVFLFPSFMMHRVTPVTKGTRKSFVLWLGGNHYK